jgi:hypothetical protein
MNMPLDWLEALKSARKALKETPAAPVWLDQALAAAEDAGPVLAPPAQAEETVPEFFYPH